MPNFELYDAFVSLLMMIACPWIIVVHIATAGSIPVSDAESIEVKFF
jgi:hypothetical protein